MDKYHPKQRGPALNNNRNKKKPKRNLKGRVAKEAAKAHDLYLRGEMSITALTNLVKEGKAVMDAYEAALADVENHIKTVREQNQIAHFKSQC